MNLRNLFSVALLLAFGIVSSGISSADETQVVSSNKTGQPNILWLVSEDNGPQLGCYGDSYADTPNIDALATKSLRYQTCWSNAPVCAPARTTLISGMYATSLGGHHMRSGVTLPSDMKLYPQLLREAGYYCTNHTKTDYNFTSQEAGWHESGKKAHYKSRPTKETPFFHIFNFTITHESKIRVRPHTLVHDPAKAPLPAYHPDTPEVRHDWAQYYDKMTAMDREVGKALRELEEAGLADSTIVFYYGDHGSGMPRSKRWPFDSGLRVPLLVHVPEAFRSLAPADYSNGGVTSRKVAFVDFAPTLCSLAGLEAPTNMQGVAFAGAKAKPEKDYLFGYRGRMDERIDLVRSVTNGRYVYMRHFYPDRPYLKHVDFMFETPTTSVWKAMFDAGELNESQAKFWQNKPYEELFDLQSDPDEVDNIAADPNQKAKLDELRSALKDWMVSTADMGLFPEAEMHRVADKTSPREFALSGQIDFTRLVNAAWDATSGDLSANSLLELASDEQPVFRFWGARGLALKGETASLLPLMQDDSPSVAVAACDGILSSGQKEMHQQASDRLLELANVKDYGHYVATAALNVIDMRVPKSESVKARLAELPRSFDPPERVGGYVGRLLDHMAQP
ncbi:Choline-sulfatase [Rubripirellula amarantea]|uniref:Choline-sulfatase n=1 Tax=Rubripirellula amarantea TaxID=2527999 RepID=A0A5C5WR05_9BACT|nr:sulfatase-like hydrolase/transferase [Rubripirellula amarantea]TWT52900.1 Choline-sulfatase [Rubripirellula amarantea]